MGVSASSGAPSTSKQAGACVNDDTRSGHTDEELRAAALQVLPVFVRNNALSDLDHAEAERLYSDPVNPFSDTPRGGSPADSPLRSRPVSSTNPQAFGLPN